MDVRVYRMKAGDEKSFQKTGEETAVLLLSGSIEFVFDDVTAKADERMFSQKDLGVCMQQQNLR